ncbi:MAG: thiolase family protein [bacterium]|nr:transporter [Deltaproteobacteria bacterium]MCP4905370.1 thiolase family protein [bacterium]
MGLDGNAAVVGVADWKPERKFTGTPQFNLEQWAELARETLEDAGIEAAEVDGLVTGGLAEAGSFVPATVAEYCGFEVNFAELIDLGGANAVGMVWRAASAIELGLCNVVVCALPSRPTPPDPRGDGNPDPRRAFGASSPAFGSPQAEFDIPYGNLAQNAGYATIAQRYKAVHGYDERAMAKLAVDQRTNACAHSEAVFSGQPISIDDVLESRMIADPLHLLEIVMPVSGGHAVVLASRERAKHTPHRPVWVKGCGERLTIKTPSYARDLLDTPVGPASEQAFSMAGVGRDEIDLACIYDCYTITALLTLEDAGFCAKGAGMDFVQDHDLTHAGDFPLNTHGGQLSYGQAGAAGGMSQVTEAIHQLRLEADGRQVPNCETAYVSGTGGVMSEQSALILRGE